MAKCVVGWGWGQDKNTSVRTDVLASCRHRYNNNDDNHVLLSCPPGTVARPGPILSVSPAVIQMCTPACEATVTVTDVPARARSVPLGTDGFDVACES